MNSNTHVIFFQGIGASDKEYMDLIKPMKKVATVYHEYPEFYKDDVKGKTVDINNYVDYVHENNKKYKNVVIICHSIGILFAIRYAKKYKVKKIISIDGSIVGKYCKLNVKRANEKFKKLIKEGRDTDKNYRIIHLINNMPVKLTKFPVKTICYRNISTEDNEIDRLSAKLASQEIANIGNLEYRVCLDKTHYPHKDKKILKSIIDEIIDI
jgi:hypothetical protein